jgi:hypothetical protein
VADPDPGPKASSNGHQVEDRDPGSGGLHGVRDSPGGHWRERTVTRFRVERFGPEAADPDDWERLGLSVERDTDSPILVASMLMPPEEAAEFRRQMALLNDVLDVEETAGETRLPAAP